MQASTTSTGTTDLGTNTSNSGTRKSSIQPSAPRRKMTLSTFIDRHAIVVPDDNDNNETNNTLPTSMEGINNGTAVEVSERTRSTVGTESSSKSHNTIKQQQQQRQQENTKSITTNSRPTSATATTTGGRYATAAMTTTPRTATKRGVNEMKNGYPSACSALSDDAFQLSLRGDADVNQSIAATLTPPKEVKTKGEIVIGDISTGASDRFHVPNSVSEKHGKTKTAEASDKSSRASFSSPTSVLPPPILKNQTRPNDTMLSTWLDKTGKPRASSSSTEDGQAEPERVSSSFMPDDSTSSSLPPLMEYASGDVSMGASYSLDNSTYASRSLGSTTASFSLDPTTSYSMSSSAATFSLASTKGGTDCSTDDHEDASLVSMESEKRKEPIVLDSPHQQQQQHHHKEAIVKDWIETRAPQARVHSPGLRWESENTRDTPPSTTLPTRGITSTTRAPSSSSTTMKPTMTTTTVPSNNNNAWTSLRAASSWNLTSPLRRYRRRSLSHVPVSGTEPPPVLQPLHLISPITERDGSQRRRPRRIDSNVAWRGFILEEPTSAAVAAAAAAPTTPTTSRSSLNNFLSNSSRRGKSRIRSSILGSADDFDTSNHSRNCRLNINNRVTSGATVNDRLLKNDIVVVVPSPSKSGPSYVPVTLRKPILGRATSTVKVEPRVDMDSDDSWAGGTGPSSTSTALRTAGDAYHSGEEGTTTIGSISKHHPIASRLLDLPSRTEERTNNVVWDESFLSSPSKSRQHRRRTGPKRRLMWTKETEPNFSDWTLLIRTNRPADDDTGDGKKDYYTDVETYHIHKTVVGLGPRASDLLLEKFDEAESTPTTPRKESTMIDLPWKAADLIPVMLDYMYTSFRGETLKGLSTTTATSLRYLADMFGVETMFHDVNEFIQNDLTTRTMDLYRMDAMLFGDDRLLKAALKFADQ